MPAIAFDGKQASAIAVAVRSAQDAADGASKGDLRELKAGVRAALRELELRLLVKFGSMLAVAAGVIIATIKMSF